MRVVLWIGTVFGGLVALFFAAVTVALLSDGDIAAAIFGLVLTAAPVALAWYCLKRLRRSSLSPRVDRLPAPPPGTAAQTWDAPQP